MHDENEIDNPVGPLNDEGRAIVLFPTLLRRRRLARAGWVKKEGRHAAYANYALRKDGAHNAQIENYLAYRVVNFIFIMHRY